MCIKPIDLVFVNVQMPMINGALFAEQLKQYIRSANEAQSFIQIKCPTFYFVCSNPRVQTFNYMMDAMGVDKVLRLPVEASLVEEILAKARREN
jgi:two-component SAPR family response regulator